MTKKKNARYIRALHNKLYRQSLGEKFTTVDRVTEPIQGVLQRFTRRDISWDSENNRILFIIYVSPG